MSRLALELEKEKGDQVLQRHTLITSECTVFANSSNPSSLRSDRRLWVS